MRRQHRRREYLAFSARADRAQGVIQINGKMDPALLAQFKERWEEMLHDNRVIGMVTSIVRLYDKPRCIRLRLKGRGK